MGSQVYSDQTSISDSVVHLNSTEYYNHLDAKLNSYSVYPPVPPEDCKLFQIAFLSTHSRDRRFSPEFTAANLEEIFTAIRDDSYAYGSHSRTLREEVGKFQNHFLNTERHIRGEPLQQVQEGVVRRGQTGKTVGLGTEFVGFSLNVSDGSGEAARWKISVKRWSAYRGAGLKKLIMDNAHTVFPVIMKELGNSFRLRETRMLLAVVVKRQVVDIEVERRVRRDRRRGIGAAVMEIAQGRMEFGDDTEILTERIEREKLGGVRMIVFKVKKMSRLQFRFYEGVDVTTSNCGHPTSASRVMKSLRKWQTQESRVSSNVRRADIDFPTRSHPFGVWDSESTETDVQAFESCSESSVEYSSDEYSEEEHEEDLSHNGNSVRFADVDGDEEEFVDIDLSESLEEFMLDQCSLANRYVHNEKGDKGLQKHGVGILRSVIVNGSLSHRRPALRAIRLLGHCYLKGCGVEQNKDFQKKLMDCADYLEDIQGNHVWNNIEEEFGLIPYQEEPEQRLMQICLLDRLKDLKRNQRKSEQLTKDYMRNLTYWSLLSEEAKQGFLGAIIMQKYLISQVGKGDGDFQSPDGHLYDTMLIPSAPTLYCADLRDGYRHYDVAGERWKYPGTGVLSAQEKIMPVPEANLFSESIRDSGPGGYVSEVDMDGRKVHVH
eukprot:GFKZ01013260.1.p1 GENE.GFKZ01013260.1~~GFKZ01013260.1.p1  ORF type:complete len:660 (+),score=96.75 GFKZ01013260.1:236-2215(+)